MLSGNRELMDKLAAHLIEKETISGKEFMKIYRKEKGIPEPEEKEDGKEREAEQEPETKEEPVTEPQKPAGQTETLDDHQKESEEAKVTGRFSNAPSDFFE